MDSIALHKFKLVRIDDKGVRRTLPEGSKPNGSEFILAYLPPKPGSFQEKNGEKRRVFLKDGFGNKIPVRFFTHYENGTRRADAPTRKLINQAIEAMYQADGTDPEKSALENAALVREEKRRVRSMFRNFLDEYANTPYKRTLKKRSVKTVG